MRWLFGFFCLHRRTSFPQSPRAKRIPGDRPKHRECYVVCLDCGREFEYDLDAMRRGAEIRGLRPKVGGLQEQS